VNNTVMNNTVKYTLPAEDGAFVSVADTARSARRRLWIVILLDRMSNDATNGYAEVNGVNMYYEHHGDGPPLVLLHGAFGTIESCFAGLLPASSTRSRSISSRCHPHALPGPALYAAFPRLLLPGEWRCSGVSRSL
jgi:hypothetical protein